MSVSEVDRQMFDWRNTQMTQSHPQKLWKIERALDVVKGLISPEDSLLDVGCGQGAVYQYLRHKNYQGIDISEKEVAAARNLYPEGKFDVGDLFSLTGTWDVVLCSRVLMHVAPIEEAIRKLLDASRKRLILVTAVSTEDTMVECFGDGFRYYFRRISKHILNSLGKPKIYEDSRWVYSVVVYDR